MPEIIVLLAVFFVAALLGIAGTVLFFARRQPKTDMAHLDALRDLERRLTDLMIGQWKEVRRSQADDSKQMHEQIYSFTKETTQIREELKQMENMMKNVSSFQELFKSPKLRGQWGEASLEHILAQHFPPELYQIQYLFSSGEQVDAVLKLPNGKILPIDAKFPSDNFVRMVEAAESEKPVFQKRFVEDVKNHINAIASKYVLPSEGTVDAALMYIPAEAIYSEIINNIGREQDLASYAWSRKVIMTSPNTLYLHLRVIEHWFRDTQMSRRTQEILKRFSRVRQDAAKLMDDFRKLGSHLKNASSAYDSSEKRLGMFSERVDRLLESREAKKLNSAEKD